MEQKNKRAFSDVANEVFILWRKKYGNNKFPVSFIGAVPYLQAMLSCSTTDKNALYGCETLETVVLYFLANVTSWRGEDAKRIKAELKEMIK